ncbi:RHG06 protein, partial [Polyodon spathula]|nr:RHG06 protein [Polyodon spathula]
MSAQGILNSVFSCSSPASKTISKRRLRQTRSLDPAVIRNYGNDAEAISDVYENTRSSCTGSREAGSISSHITPQSSAECLATSKPGLRCKSLKSKQPLSSFSSPCTPTETSPSSHFQFDYDIKGVKRNTAWDVSFLARSPALTPPGSTSTIFSPRKWLQKKLQQSSSQSYIVWKSEFSIERTLSSSMSTQQAFAQSVPVCMAMPMQWPRAVTQMPFELCATSPGMAPSQSGPPHQLTPGEPNCSIGFLATHLLFRIPEDTLADLSPPHPDNAQPIVCRPLGTPVHGRQWNSLDSNRMPHSGSPMTFKG